MTTKANSHLLLIIFYLAFSLLPVSSYSNSRRNGNSSCLAPKSPLTAGLKAEQQLTSRETSWQGQSIIFPYSSPEHSEGMPAEKLLAALGLEDPERAVEVEITSRREEFGLTIKTVRVPERNDFAKCPQGLTILQNELVDAEMLNLRNFELLYNAQGRLIAVFPLIPPEIHSRDKIIDLDPKYFDFSPYYFQLPQIGDAQERKTWLSFRRQLIRHDLPAIQAYKEAIFAENEDLVVSVCGEQAPYVYLEIHRLTGEYRVKEIDLDSNDPLPGTSSFQKDSSKHQLIIPIFPTVYSPASDHYDQDRDYVELLWNDLNWKMGKRTVVFGPGAGTDTWLAHLKTGGEILIGEIKTEYDEGISPLEMANLQATAVIAGIPIRKYMGGKVEIALWNMPAYASTPRDPALFKYYSRFRELWDADYGGLILRGFSGWLEKNLAVHGQALTWNTIPDDDYHLKTPEGVIIDDVEEILQSAGRYQRTPETRANIFRVLVKENSVDALYGNSYLVSWLREAITERAGEGKDRVLSTAI